MKPILVTGATGFLGGHLVEELKRSGTGDRLRLLCRGPSKWDADKEVTVVRGDITVLADLNRAMEGVGEVYHLAGHVSRDPRDSWRLHQVHVGGTRHLCEAACKHKPEKIVLVSSSGTVAVSREPVIHDETSGYKHEVVGNWAYYLSKIFAEKVALHYFDRDRLPVVIANPALLLGPGDERNSSTGDVALFLDGQILAYPQGGMSFVDARDAAAGLIAAMRFGRPGERYLLGGPNWTFRKLIQHASEISGVRPPLYELPLPAARASAWVLRRLCPLLGRKFDMDDVTIQMASMFWYCSSAKAASELGFRTRDPLETLRDTIQDIRRRQPAIGQR